MRTPESGIAELSRLNPSKSGDEQLSLKEDVDRMKKAQNDTYSFACESIAVVSSSPFLCARRDLRYFAQ